MAVKLQWISTVREVALMKSCTEQRQREFRKGLRLLVRLSAPPAMNTSICWSARSGIYVQMNPPILLKIREWEVTDWSRSTLSPKRQTLLVCLLRQQREEVQSEAETNLLKWKEEGETDTEGPQAP